MWRVLSFILAPCLIARLYWKGRRFPAYRHRVRERFAAQCFEAPVDIWLHAVSLGEVVAATALIEMYLAEGYRVCVTTMTPTGSQQVLTYFKTRVVHYYIPYDFPHYYDRFLEALQPRVVIIMETELWPHLLMSVTRRHIPLFLANARISDRAFIQYQKMRWLFKPLLRRFSGILAQSDLDAVRYKALGADASHVHVVGNMKCDKVYNFSSEVNFHGLKQQWGETRPVFVLGSTHEGEEALILNEWSSCLSAIPNMLLMIAPRHPERFDDVVKQCQHYGYRVARRTEASFMTPEHQIFVLDSLGELPLAYAVSDYAFIGGSLVPVGGHDIAEPICLGVLTFCGPYMQNMRSWIDGLKAVDGVNQVDNAKTLRRVLIARHYDKAYQVFQKQQATQYLDQNRGAVLRHKGMIKWTCG